ncbi:MAG: efflux RND transporter permease subunit, partial [Planctomycetaceae bacterium]
MNRLFRRLASWSVERRWPSLLLIVLLSAAAVIGWKFTELQQLVLSDDAGSEAVDDDSQARRNRRRRGGAAGMFDSHSILVVESKHLFTPDGATALRQIVDELESLDYVNHVLWMDRIPVLNVFGLSEPLFPRSGASDRRFAAAKEKALNNPLVVGQLLSQDAETLLMLLTFDLDFVFSNEEVTSELKKTAIAAAADFPELELKFQVTGNYPAFIAAVGQHESNQTLFMSVGFGMIALMALILFRGLQTVVIVSIAPAVGVAWTLGMIQFVKYSENNGLIDIVLPVLVALVAITDGVHLMVQTRKLRASGMSAQEAAQKGLQQVGFACFLTSFTTAIGFASLTLADHSMVQDFGKCCVIGVVMSFLSVVTIIPLLCSTRLGRDIHVGLENSLIDRHLSRISGLIDVVLKHRRILSLTGIVATVVLFAVCLTLEPDQRARDNLPANAEATIAMNHLDKVLGGLESSQIEVHWPEHVRADDPLILEAVMAVDDILRTEELIGHPLSIRDLIEAQPGSGPLAERMSMLELLPPPIKDIFISPEERRAIVTFRVQDLGIARYGPVFERVEASLAGFATQFSGFEFELVGSAARRWRNLYQIVVDLAASLGTASVIIFVVLAFVFRSVRIGLISIVPNLFPLVLSGTWLVVSGYNLEVVMVCCFTICLGIAVDDTIHFLSRYHEELKESSGTLEAIRRAFTGVGTALIMTTLVL